MKSIRPSLLLSLAALGWAVDSAPASTHEPNASNEASIEGLWTSALHESRRLTDCPATSEEIASDAILSLTKRSPEYAKKCLRTTVKNKFIDRKRRERRETLFDQLGDDGLEQVESTERAGSLEEESRISEFLENLDDEERLVLEWLESGLSEREIAAELSTRRHWVRSVKDRLKQKAATILNA